MNPKQSRFLPAPGKLLVALSAAAGASQAGAAIVYTDFGPSGLSNSFISFNISGSYDIVSSGEGDREPYAFTIQSKGGIYLLSRSNGYVAQSGSTLTLFGTDQLIGPTDESGLDFTDHANLTYQTSGNTPGYLGLRFDLYDGTQYYGWAKVADNSPDVTLFGVAYDNAGGSILTGDTGAPAIPEPVNTAFLVSLAAGAVAALAARRKRKAKALAAAKPNVGD